MEYIQIGNHMFEKGTLSFINNKKIYLEESL